MLLIDTHILVWELQGDPRVHLDASSLIQDELRRRRLFVSAVTFWELARLTLRGRIDLGSDVRAWRLRRLESGIREIGLDAETMILAEELRLQGTPADPSDRLIMATAITRHATLATADRVILAWDGPLDRLDVRV